MSEILGSCSSGSSGPSPKTSCSTSSLICSFSAAVSRFGSLGHDREHRLPHFRANAVVIDPRQHFQVDPVEQLVVQRELQLLVLGIERDLGFDHWRFRSSPPDFRFPYMMITSCGDSFRNPAEQAA